MSSPIVAPVLEDKESVHTSANEETTSLDSRARDRKILALAYSALVVTAFVETFANDSTSGLNSFATSQFNAHLLISTVAVVYKITAIVSYPFLAKLNDLFGRTEGFGFAVLVYTLAYVLYASARNPQTYVCAEILFAIGKIGYRVFQQVFIADTTSLINRGFWSQFPDAIAAIPSLYVGSVIQDAFIDHSTWRWGYGCWAIIMFAMCCILTGFMFVLEKKTKFTGGKKVAAILENLPEGSIFKKAFHFVFVRLDIVGGFLLLSGLVLLFIPLTLTGKASPFKWHEAKLIVMLVIGAVLFIGFLFYNAYVPKYPFVERNALVHKTMLIACLIMALDWCENLAFSIYMKTTLQVSKYVSVGEATRIDDSKKACLQVFSIVGGLMMKYTKRSKIFVVTGFPLMFLGHVLLVCFVNTGDGMANRGLLYMAEVFIGAGRGIAECALQVMIQAIAGETGIAMSTSFFLASSSVGSLCGSCIAGGIWNSLVLRKLNKYLPAGSKKKASKIFKSLPTALKYKKGTPERDAIARAYRETQQLIGWATVGIICPILILMWFVDNVYLTDHVDIYLDDKNDMGSLTVNANIEIIQLKNLTWKERLARFNNKSTKEKLSWLVGI